jgi:NADH-quinone oxidoreductase subunit J
VLAEIVMVVASRLWVPGAFKGLAAAQAPAPTDITNTHALGKILYTQYVYVFQGAGLILLVAMIGAIVLTLRQRTNVKRQDIGVQNARTKSTAMDVVKVPVGGSVIPEKVVAIPEKV